MTSSALSRRWVDHPTACESTEDKQSGLSTGADRLLLEVT